MSLRAVRFVEMPRRPHLGPLSEAQRPCYELLFVALAALPLSPVEVGGQGQGSSYHVDLLSWGNVGQRCEAIVAKWLGRAFRKKPMSLLRVVHAADPKVFNVLGDSRSIPSISILRHYPFRHFPARSVVRGRAIVLM